MTREHLNHPYITRVELIHGTKLPVREHWEEVVQELAAVGNIPLGPEHEEVIDLLSPTTRFLRHLEEDLVPSHFNFTVDSDRDHNFPHSLTQTVTHALRLGNLEPLLTPVTQILTISKERDPNNDTPAPDPPAPELLPSQQLLHGESLERWLEADLHPDLVVLRPFDSTGHILEKYKRQRERNWSRRKLHKRRELISSTSARSANGKTIIPPPSLVNVNYALGQYYKSHADTFNFLSDLPYEI